MKTVSMRKARIIANMTESEACAAMHITKDQLEAWENGKSIPSWKRAETMSEAYQIPLDLISFQKDDNQPEIPRKLTLEEIKALPKASVIWKTYCLSSDDGIVHYSADPAVICETGENRMIIGGSAEYIFNHDIDDDLLADPDRAFWNHEPVKGQINGITDEEYNAVTETDEIIYPKLATAITSRCMTFERFCELTKLDTEKFWDAITGRRDFDPWEIETISTALNLTESESEAYFSTGKVFDISTGRPI